MGEQNTNIETEVETEVENTTGAETEVQTEESAEVKRLKAEMAKQKAALDKATKEAAGYKRQLNANKSAEEQAAEERAEQFQAMQEELNLLRKERTVATTAQKITAFVQDTTVSAEIANALYGAEDVDAAITALQKAWTAKEKALRMEFKQIPAPGVGSADGPTVTEEQLNAMTMAQRSEFARKSPEEYRTLIEGIKRKKGK